MAAMVMILALTVAAPLMCSAKGDDDPVRDPVVTKGAPYSKGGKIDRQRAGGVSKGLVAKPLTAQPDKVAELSKKVETLGEKVDNLAAVVEALSKKLSASPGTDGTK